MLLPGNGQTLSATFTPLDSSDFNTATASTTINVLPGTNPGVQIIVTRILTRQANGNILVLLTLANAGLTAANNVSLTAVRIGTMSGTPLPQAIGNIGSKI